MPTGTPDFGAQPTGSTVSPTFDQGEISNRLLMAGGNLSRSGRWFWATGFESGAVTDFLVTGVNTPSVRNCNPNWQGNYALYSQTQAVLNDKNVMTKWLVASQNTGNWGIEAMVSPQSLNTDIDFRFYVFVNGGARVGIYRVNIGASASSIKIQYSDGAGVYQDIASLGTTFAIGNVYHNIKAVFDLKNYQYVRISVDGVTYETPGLPFPTPAPGSDSRVAFQIEHNTRAAAASVVYIDNVILTADEP